RVRQRVGRTAVCAVATSTGSSGAASVSYTLPGGTPAATYKIVATYNPSSNFQTSSDSQRTLTISQRATATTAQNASSTYSEQAVNVTLSATASASYSTVTAGTITFQVKDGSNNNVGSAVTSGTVNASGAASVSYSLPADTAAGTYKIVATYYG